MTTKCEADLCWAINQSPLSGTKGEFAAAATMTAFRKLPRTNASKMVVIAGAKNGGFRQ